jgi:hypothetical protein
MESINNPQLSLPDNLIPFKKEQGLRQLRNTKLTDIDRVNPVRYSLLSEQQRQELITYRQQLLDVPQQQEFPDHVVWPQKPQWL